VQDYTALQNSKNLLQNRAVSLDQKQFPTKADRPITHDTLNAPLITDKQTIPMDWKWSFAITIGWTRQAES